MKLGLFLASLFWVFLILFHSNGHGWIVSALISFSSMVAGALVAFGWAEWKERHNG